MDLIITRLLNNFKSFARFCIFFAASPARDAALYVATDEGRQINQALHTILAAVSILSTFANKGNVSTGQYYVQRTINVIGLFGLWYAGISIALLIVETSYGDDIEKFLRK